MLRYLKPVAHERNTRMGFVEKTVRVAVFLPLIILLNLPMIAILLICMLSVGGLAFGFLLYGISKDPWAYSTEIALGTGLLIAAIVGRKVGNYLTWNFLPGQVVPIMSVRFEAPTAA